MPADQQVRAPGSVAAATVRTEPMEFTDQLGKFLNVPGPPEGVWVDYAVTSRYERAGKRYMLGVTSPAGYNGDTAAFVQLAKPTLLWVAQWTAARFGVQPVAPAKDLGDSRWVFLDEHLEAPHVTVAGDGVTPFYRISGLYVYGCKRPSDALIKDVEFPRPPWLEDAFDRTYPESLLEKNLLEANSKALFA